MSHVFISHRHEYAKQVSALKSAIQECSNGKVRVFISEDIPRGEDWRGELEKTCERRRASCPLRHAEEDHHGASIAGYFAAQCPGAGKDRTTASFRPRSDPQALSHLRP